MGELKTPLSFKSACSKFITLEELLPQIGVTKNEATENPELLIDFTSITHQITTIINNKSDDNGWIALGKIGNVLNSQIPDFDCKIMDLKILVNF